MPWGIEEWGEGVWGGGGIKFGTLDDDGNVVPIPPGSLDAIGSMHARLWKQFVRAQTWIDLFGIIGGAFQDVEETLQSFADNRYVGNAPGQVLDEVGALVNLPRGGQTSDAAYRLAIIAEATSLVVSGTIPEILDLARRLAPASTIHLRNRYPAAFFLIVTDLNAASVALLTEIMADTPPSGVGAFLVTFDPDLTSGWASVSGGVTTPGRWASVSGPVDPPFLWSSVAAIG